MIQDKIFIIILSIILEITNNYKGYELIGRDNCGINQKR
jgi:hypothetical protein